MKEKLRILVVDDNKEFCENVKDVLELKEYEVQTAYDGFKALDIIKQNVIDLVLMDIKMPVMNGVDAFKKIKKIAPHTQVIMITAFAVEELIQDALSNGAFSCLKKPLDFELLFSKIEEAFSTGSMILIVDDNKQFCENTRDVLTDKGYSVRIATDSNSAIKTVKENHFDIMLLDMKLPPLNGLETYLAIRKIQPDLTVMIITGYLKEIDNLLYEALRKSSYTCIEKPINMDQLISLLQKIEKQKKSGKLEKSETGDR